DLPRMKVGPGTARIRVASPGLQAHELELALRGRSSPLDRVDHLSPRVRVGEPMQARRVRPHEPGRERRDFLRIAAVADGRYHPGRGVGKEARGIAIALPEGAFRSEIDLRERLCR